MIHLFYLGELCQEKTGLEEDGQIFVEYVHFGMFRCQICHVVYSKSEDLISHGRSHDIGIDEWHCRVCQMDCGTADQLREHLLQNHGNEYTHFCFQCGRAFMSYSTYNAHGRMFHRKNKSCPMCPICGKAYPYESQLQIHLKKHSSEQPFTCQICGKMFKHEWNLKVHPCLQASAENH